jgi:hypothetical protein
MLSRPRLSAVYPSLQVFVYLQVLDALTTLLAFRTGLVEASPVVQLLVRMGPLTGLLGAKIVALLLAGICVWRERYRMIHWVNYWYAAAVVWNIIVTLSWLHR